MSIWNLVIKNLKIKNAFVTFGIILLAISLGSIFSVNYLSDIYSSNAKKDYLNYSNDQELQVLTEDFRAISQNEIESIRQIDKVDTVVEDFNFSLPITGMDKKVIFHPKLQEFKTDLKLELNRDIKDEQGVILPDISIKSRDGEISLRDYTNKDLFLMVEKTNDNNELYLDYYPIPIIGVYETDLDEHRAPAFVTKKLMEDIPKADGDLAVYALQVKVNDPQDINGVSQQIEGLNLRTTYFAKEVQNITNNIKELTLAINLMLAIILLIGVLLFIIFFRTNLKKRSSELAVLKAMGYSNYKIGASIFIQQLLYILISSILASVCFFVITNFILFFNIIPISRSIDITLSMIVITLFKSILVGLILSILSTTPALIKIRFLNPIDYLKEP